MEEKQKSKKQHRLGQIKIGIEAPREVVIAREEVQKEEEYKINAVR